ncbi:MAG: hypothetical protein ACR2LL_07065 [Nitrosopumilus sp.]
MDWAEDSDKDNINMRKENEKIQVNPTITKKADKILNEEAKRRKMAPTTFKGQILEKYAFLTLQKEKRGDLILGKRVIKLMLECETEKDYKIKSKEAARYINAETLAQMGDVSYEERRKRIETWWKEINRFDFTETKKDNEKIKWFVLHDMGERWSKFQCYMNKNLLEIVGSQIIDEECGYDDLSFHLVFKKSGRR